MTYMIEIDYQQPAKGEWIKIIRTTCLLFVFSVYVRHRNASCAVRPPATRGRCCPMLCGLLAATAGSSDNVGLHGRAMTASGSAGPSCKCRSWAWRSKSVPRAVYVGGVGYVRASVWHTLEDETKHSLVIENLLARAGCQHASTHLASIHLMHSHRPFTTAGLGNQDPNATARPQGERRRGGEEEGEEGKEIGRMLRGGFFGRGHPLSSKHRAGTLSRHGLGRLHAVSLPSLTTPVSAVPSCIRWPDTAVAQPVLF
ncbi:hypothetical protein F4802DRAFT_113475 [Xylaria palmicola]|nr:hypothetical protein F4802DRAFT_113475 [Xylaria palmicola]